LMSGSLVIGATSSDTSYNAGSWFNNSGLAVGNITSTSGIQINSSPTSTLSSIRFGDGDGANNLYDQGFINYNHNLDRLAFGTNRGTAMTITSTGLVELPYGQLKFPASQNASSDANTLDDYEEGTWTPVIRGANTAGTYEIASHYSHYTKIGRQVTVTTRIIMAASITGGGSSYLQVTGLPFAKVANTEAQGVIDTKGIDTLGNYIVLKFVTIGSTSVVYIYEGYDNGNPTDLSISALSANDEFGFTITYIV